MRSAAAESLYWSGELCVHHRVHTRRVWDLARRLIPAEILDRPDPHADPEAHLLWHVERRVGSLGIGVDRSGEAWLGIRGVRGGGVRRALHTLVDRGLLEPLRIEGVKPAAFARTPDLARFTESGSMTRRPRATAAILAPLDNLLWDRRLVAELFDFDYVWEVYVPASRRRWGYYVLPVLYGDRLVARFEPKLDRAAGVLTIGRWWWERGVEMAAPLERAVTVCLAAFLRYLAAGAIRFRGKIRRFDPDRFRHAPRGRANSFDITPGPP